MAINAASAPVSFIVSFMKFWAEEGGLLSAIWTSGVCEGFGHADEVSEKPDRRRITAPEAMAAKSSLDFR
jgi:hypothetical protein